MAFCNSAPLTRRKAILDGPFPDLDDEEDILKRRVRDARRSLGNAQLAATIHRYDSLALLNQVVFGMPNGNFANLAFGSITSQANASRSVQFGLKLLW